MTFPNGADYADILKKVETGDAYSYFRDWSRFVYQFSRYQKPLISLMSGRVADCLAGLLLHTPYRMAFDDSVWYLPQTEQGFFPDSGLTYFLPRLHGSLGMYLALTGKKLYGSDLVHAGIATHFMPNSSMPQLVESLVENGGHYSVVGNIVEWHDRLETKGKPYSLAPYLELIDRCFGLPSVDHIFIALDKEKNPATQEFVKETISALRHKSPLSLKITFKALISGSRLSISSCIKQEYRIAKKLATSADFKEGFNAMVGKRRPVWSASSLTGVPEQELLSYFKTHNETKKLMGKDGKEIFNASDLELSLPLLDYQPGFIKEPKWADGELFDGKSRDAESADLAERAQQTLEQSQINKDIVGLPNKWFSFDKY